MPATGTSTWSLTLQRKLAKGHYRLLTRAVGERRAGRGPRSPRRAATGSISASADPLTSTQMDECWAIGAGYFRAPALRCPPYGSVHPPPPAGGRRPLARRFPAPRRPPPTRSRTRPTSGCRALTAPSGTTPGPTATTSRRRATSSTRSPRATARRSGCAGSEPTPRPTTRRPRARWTSSRPTPGWSTSTTRARQPPPQFPILCASAANCGNSLAGPDVPADLGHALADAGRAAAAGHALELAGRRGQRRRERQPLRRAREGHGARVPARASRPPRSSPQITQAGALGDPFGSGMRTVWWVRGVGPVKIVVPPRRRRGHARRAASTTNLKPLPAAVRREPAAAQPRRRRDASAGATPST